MADKLSPAARCVANLAIVAMGEKGDPGLPGLYRVLANAACYWDSKSVRTKWEAYGALQGAIDVLSPQCEWADGTPEAHGWALCEFAQAILRAEYALDRQREVERAQDYLRDRMGVTADLEGRAETIQWNAA